ncbi:hypothetical protein ACFY8B_36695, partial [Streptomyces sp. NPDC012751]|uniref:hypothetical protein n=1 Tax=Streptomyces sp. NPDC012751 TaxID=3364846 RepID=UPI0036B77612
GLPVKGGSVQVRMADTGQSMTDGLRKAYADAASRGRSETAARLAGVLGTYGVSVPYERADTGTTGSGTTGVEATAGTGRAAGFLSPADADPVGVDAVFAAAVGEEPLLAGLDPEVVRRALEIRQGVGGARMGIGADAAEARTRWWRGVSEVARALGMHGEAGALATAERLAAQESAAEQGAAGVRGVGRVGLAGGAPARRQQSTGQARQGSQSDQVAVPQSLKARVDAGLRGVAVTPARAGQVLRVVEAAARVEGSWHEEWPVEQVATVVAARSWTVQEHGATIQALTRPGRLHVAEVAAAKPLLAELMHRHPTLLEVLTDAHKMLQRMAALPDATVDAYRLRPASVEGLLIEQGGRRPFVEALDGRRLTVPALLELPGLTIALRNHVPLIMSVSGVGPAGAALLNNRRLADALVTTYETKGEAYTKTFGTEWALSQALGDLFDFDHADLLGNLGLRRKLQQHADLAHLLVTAPKLLAAAMKDLEVIDLLVLGEPGFIDVLEDVPAFAGRLAGRMEWLRAAVGNHHAVAQVLSLEPGHFDAVGDEELEQALREAEAPLLPEREQAVPSGSLLEGARAANPGLAALLAREPHLTGVLESDPELTETLANHPTLLVRPHHFRRLLTDRVEDLRSQVREGSPLLAPYLLRAALRHRIVRLWLTSDGPLAKLPASDLRRQTAVDIDTNPVVGQMLFETPTYGQLLYLAPELIRVEVLTRIWDERPTDEVAQQLMARPGFSLAAVDMEDMSVFLEVVLRDETALLRVAGETSNMLTALADQSIANLLPHPGLVRELAARSPVDISYDHWRALFDNGALLEAMSGDLGLLGLLASAPAVFAEAIARPGFVEALQKPEFRDAVAEARRRRRDKKKNWATGLMDAVVNEELTGPPELSPEGVPLTPQALALAELWHLDPDTDRDKFLLAAEGSQELLQEQLAVDAAVRPNAKLFEAARKSKALGAALHAEGDLLPLLNERPALLPRLLDRSSGLLRAVISIPRLPGALRTNDSLYQMVLSGPDVGRLMTTRPDWAGALVANRELARFFHLSPHRWSIVVSNEAVWHVVESSESMARAFADNAPVVEELSAVDAGPLLAVLNELDASPGRTAVVDLAASGVVLVRWLKRNPQAVAGLVAVPR